MKTTIVSNVSKTVAGCLLACGVMVSPVLAKGGHGGGGHGGGGHHGGGHHAPHHGGAHHAPNHRGGEHHGEHHEQHHSEHHTQHHDTHHADRRNDHRDHHDDRHVHYHYDHHHYYGGGGSGWGWLPTVWGWPGYVGPDYGDSVNYTTVNNNTDTTNTSTTDDSENAQSNVAQNDSQELPPLNNRGIIRVKLPNSRAVVTFDGHKILGSRMKRLIVTSPIEGDGPVKYQVHATWWQDGVQQHEVREGFVSAGGNVLADFTQPQPAETTFTQAPAE